MKLTAEQKNQILTEIIKFIKGGGLNQKELFPILLKLNNPELLLTEDDFFDFLENKIQAITGRKPQWINSLEWKRRFKKGPFSSVYRSHGGHRHRFKKGPIAKSCGMTSAINIFH